jgi:membrane protein YfhO
MRHPDWHLLALWALVLAYNAPQLISGSVQFDGVDVHYAAQRYLSDELHAGRIPFWTPFIFSGFPFLADLQVAAWYPPNWPFFLVGITPRSIGAELALHSLIACTGTYVLARRVFGMPPTPALAAAVFYALSGWFATHFQHVGMFDTAAWLPWLLLLLDRLRRSVTLRKTALAAALGAAIILPGHFQLALYTFAFVGVWATAEAVVLRSWRAARGLALGLAAAGLGGALLSAVMLLPALELVSQSERSRLNALALPDIGYFHPAALLTLADPDFYGLLSGHYTGPGDSTQHYFYAGIVLVPLALLGLRDRRVLRTALVLSVPFLWYALGPIGGLYRLVARLPGFSSVELPMHGWFLVALGVALLGGAGMSVVERRVGCRWSRALVVVLVLDVLAFNQLLNPLAFARQDFETLYGSALADFQAQVAAAQPTVQRVYAPELTAVGYRNHALQSRVETTYGYNPLELAAYADYVAAAEGEPRLIAGLAATHQLRNGALSLEPGTLPMAYFAPRVESPRGLDLANLDPSSVTILDGDLPDVQADPAATVGVASRGLDWLTLQYASSTSNLLRIAIPIYPGWQATRDGVPLPLVRVDGAFIGVVVPPGEGEVRLRYTPRLFWLGAAISGLTFVVLLAAYQKARGPSSL